MMKRLILLTFTTSILTVFLTACGEADMEGIILDIDEERITLAQNLTPKEYEEIKDKSGKTLQNEDVAGERDRLNLLILTYDDVDKLQIGDEVNAWIDGEIMLSYPGQANAKKIKVKK